MAGAVRLHLGLVEGGILVINENLTESIVNLVVSRDGVGVSLYTGSAIWIGHRVEVIECFSVPTQ